VLSVETKPKDLKVPTSETSTPSSSPPKATAEFQTDPATGVVDSASSPSIESVTVDTTVSADTPSQPTAASNVEEDQQLPQITRPSCFVSVLPTASPDNANSTTSKDLGGVDSGVPGSRERCRSADRQVVDDRKEHLGGPGRRGQLTPQDMRSGNI